MQMCRLGCLSGGSADIKIVSNSKMSEINQGGQHFPKMSEGGGVNPNLDIVPNFPVFFSDTSPLLSRPTHPFAPSNLK